MSEFQFNTIDEILEDLRDGKIVVMIDDEAVSYTHLTLPTNSRV